MPHADAVHGHVGRLVAHAELNVVAADEERHGQPVLAHGRERDAAVPPGTVGIRHLDALALVGDDVLDHIDLFVDLYATIARAIEHCRDVLELARGVLEREHGAVDECALVLALREREQVEGADEALGHDRDVVVHEEDMRKALALIECRHHAARKATRAARVGIRDDGHHIAGKRRSVERLPVIDHEHVEVVAHGAVLARDTPLDELDVRQDIALVLERGRGERELNVVDDVLGDLGKVERTLERDRGGAVRDHREADQIELGGIDLEVEGMDSLTLERLLADDLKIRGVRARNHAAHHHATCTLGLNVQVDGVDTGVLTPFAG